MSDEEIRDTRLETELINPVYDIINEIIEYNIKKYDYKEYDLVKLVMMLYKGEYKYLTNDNEYRDQYIMLDDYFKKQYNHSIITFEMLKTLVNLKGTKKYDSLMKELAEIEKVLRSNDGLNAENLCLLSYPIENKKYDDIMYLIERNISVKYAIAIIYDKIKLKIDNNY
ncbi:MAG: hypothetical protein IKG27_03640 [Bacilli bacterium]|nr:hypothetical protein [Bacilli bacterium]